MDIDERCEECTYRYKNIPEKCKEYKVHPSERCIECLIKSGKYLVRNKTNKNVEKVEVAYERG